MSRRIALSLAAAALACAVPAVLAPGAAHGDSPEPSQREALVELGRRLFFDPAIGRQGRIGCSSCHDPEHGFSDARVLSLDENGLLPRHSQPLTDLAGEGFHWDGEFDTVRDVIDARILPGLLPAQATAARSRRRLERAANVGGADAASVEALLQSLGRFSAYYGDVTDSRVVTTIAQRLAGDGRYDRGFGAAFGSANVTPQRLGDALEAYLRTLTSSESPFDEFLAGDREAISPAAVRGYLTFRGKGACALCHTVEGRRPQLTDGRFHNTGVAARHAKLAFSDVLDPARVATTFNGADRGAYKTPSLRDVARRAPWFHDGSAKSLEEVVRYYAGGCTANDHLDARLHPFELSDAEVKDVVAFLESLTGRERSGLGPVTSLRSERLKVRVETLEGQPAHGVRVVLRPFGDRLAGTRTMPASVSGESGADGNVAFDMPASTHVLVEVRGAGAQLPVPDWTSSVTLVVTPKDQISVVVRFPDIVRTHPEEIAVTNSSGCIPASFAVSFRRVRELAAGKTLYAAAAPTDHRGAASYWLAIPGMAQNGPAVSVDFTPGAANHVELFAAAPAGGSDASAAIRNDADEIARLASALRTKR